MLMIVFQKIYQNIFNRLIMKVVILLGSESDKGFVEDIVNGLGKYDVASEVIVASAHKVPEKVFEIVSSNNESDEDIVYVTVAGRSNGLSGVTAANSIHPVIACPPFQDKDDFSVNINSTLCMPSDTPVLTVIDKQNVVMCILRIFALKDAGLKQKVKDRIVEIKSKFN